MAKSSVIKSNTSDHKSGLLDRQADRSATAFGERLRLRAGELGLNSAEIGRRAGITKQTMQGYWAGDRLCGSDKLFALADALDTDPRWLIEGHRTSARPVLIDAADADWVEIERFDLRNLTEFDKGAVLEQLPFRRDWLNRRLHRSSGLWMTELPGDYEALGLYEGDIVICSDIITGDGPRDGWLCIFRSIGGLFVARYLAAEGIARAGERIGESYVAASHVISGEVQPIARVHAQLLARL